MRSLLVFAMLLSFSTAFSKANSGPIQKYGHNGFAAKESDDFLEVSVERGDTMAHPVALKSCSDISQGATTGSLKEASADFRKLIFTWHSANKASLYLDYMTITLKGSYLRSAFVKTFSADELQDIFGSLSTSVSSGDDAPKTTSCFVRIGGINFSDPTKPGFAKGTLSLQGVSTDADGNHAAVEGSTDISVQYEGIPAL